MNDRAAPASLAARQRELLATLAPMKDAQERLAWLVAQARARAPMDAAMRTEAHRVDGCLARLWFAAEFRDGCCYYQCDSDSLVVKAVAGLLCDFYSGHAPGAISAHDPAFLGRLGLTQHLTPNRRNTLSRLWEKIRAFAQSH